MDRVLDMIDTRYDIMHAAWPGHGGPPICPLVILANHDPSVFPPIGDGIILAQPGARPNSSAPP